MTLLEIALSTYGGLNCGIPHAAEPHQLIQFYQPVILTTPPFHLYKWSNLYQINHLIKPVIAMQSLSNSESSSSPQLVVTPLQVEDVKSRILQMKQEGFTHIQVLA
jgi:hypothetical protein